MNVKREMNSPPQSPVQKILNDDKAPERLRRLCLERSVFRERSPFPRKFRRLREKPPQDTQPSEPVRQSIVEYQEEEEDNSNRFRKVYEENLLAAIKTERVDLVERHLAEAVRSGALTKVDAIVRRALEFISSIPS